MGYILRYVINIPIGYGVMNLPNITTMSLTVVYTNEAIEEIEDSLNSLKHYIKPDGSLAFSPVTDILEYVVKTMADPDNKLYTT